MPVNYLKIVEMSKMSENFFQLRNRKLSENNLAKVQTCQKTTTKKSKMWPIL